ncbi:hypothetical protein ACQEXU_01925 [Vibrio sp. TRT 21S02]|uniref:hypothetical protein n=1 Tax=Vibrio sp. TRT 21S02 TaxID=3418507 RepID=UPI003CF83C9B
MKQLTTTSADVYLRHYKEDTFKEIKDIQDKKELTVVTYTSVNYLISGLDYIQKNFIQDNTRATIIFGIHGLESKNAEERLNHFYDYLSDNQEKYSNTDIFFHARCHIKLIYCDGVLFVGSQNISATSDSFDCNFNRSLNKNNEKGEEPTVYNNNELLIRFSDNDKRITNTIVNNLIDDVVQVHQVQLSGKTTPVSIDKIKNNYAASFIDEFASELTDSVQNLNDIDVFYEPKEQLFEVDSVAETVARLVNLYEAIEPYQLLEQGSSYSDVHKALTEFYEWAFCGECPICNSPDFEELEEKVEAFHQINSDFALDLDLSAISLEKIEFFLLPKHDDIADFAISIKEVLERNDLTSLKSFRDANLFEIVSYIASQPSDYALHNYIDGDGNVSNSDIERAIYDDCISEGEQLEALLDNIKDIVTEVGQLIYEESLEATRNYFKRRIIKFTKQMKKYQN